MSLFPSNPGQARYAGKLHSLKVTESVLGTTIPVIFGTQRVHSKLLDYDDFVGKKDPNAGGKGIFGGKTSVNDYFAAVDAALCEGPIGGILSIWSQNGKLSQQGMSETFTVPANGQYPVTSGGQFQNDLGVAFQRPYSATANDFGSAGAQTLSGTQNVPLTRVTGRPAQGQYSIDTTLGVYVFHPMDAGETAVISYSYSLYYSQATEATMIPTSSPYAFNPANQSYFYKDVSVVYVTSGQPLTRVDGTPQHGQYQVSSDADSGGTYFFSAADAGLEVYVSYSFTSSDSGYTPSSKLTMTTLTGGPGQEPVAYMVAKHPGKALAYKNIAHVFSSALALGTSGVLPDYNYEVIGLCAFGSGILDALITDAMTALFTNPLWGAGYPPAALADWTVARNYWLANHFFISAVLNTPQSAASIAGDWLKAGNVAAVQSEGLLKLVPYGDASAVGNGASYTPPTSPVYDFGVDDFIREDQADDPVQINRTAARDAKNWLQVQWSDRNNSYNNALQPEWDDNAIRLYGFRPDAALTYDFLTTPAAATFAGQKQVARNVYIRSKFKWKSDYRKSWLEPMDIVTLTDGGSLWREPVRITEIEEAPDGTITFAAEEFPYGVATPAPYQRQVAASYQPTQGLSDPGPTTPFIFETTVQETNGSTNVLKVAATSTNPNWGGCNVWGSADGVTYTKQGTIVSTSRLGVLSAPLALAADPDTTNSLMVDMSLSNGVIDSVTHQIANNLDSLCALIDASGNTELIAYETATLTGPNQYTLTYLRRGAYSTTAAAHPAGTRFVLLDENPVELDYRAVYVNQQIYLKFTSFNLNGGAEQALADVPPYQHTISGTTLGPPSPGSFATNPASLLTGGLGVIVVNGPFQAYVGSSQATCLPSGNYIIGTLLPATTYYVYYVDPAFTGGNISPIATKNVGDFMGKAGYYSLGSARTL